MASTNKGPLMSECTFSILFALIISFIRFPVLFHILIFSFSLLAFIILQHYNILKYL